MQLSDIYAGLGPERLAELLRSISLGKLKTYRLYERLKARLRVTKLNTETLRKVAPRVWDRLFEAGGEELGAELAQVILISHLEMVGAVLNELGIPNEDGFFAKDLDATQYLTEGWQQRVYEKFRGQYPEALLLFYINHLGWELGKAETIFQPVAAGAGGQIS